MPRATAHKHTCDQGSGLSAIDRYRLEQAGRMSLGAACTRRSVGAALYSAEGYLVGIGANRSRVRGLSCLEGDCPRGTKTTAEVPSYEQGNHDFTDCIATHAEAAALVNAHAFKAPVLYVTCEPCQDCWTLIGWSTVGRVVWPQGEWTRGD